MADVTAFLSRWRGRLARLLFPAVSERAMDEELRLHLELEARELERAGLSSEEARRQARVAFGGIERVKEEARDALGTRWIEDFIQDLRYGIRGLRQHPGFAAVVLLILGLGIGANAATFSLMNALMLRPLPVADPARLVTIGDPARTGSMSEGDVRTDLASAPLFMDIRAGVHSLSGLYANGRAVNLDVLVETSGGTAPAPEHPKARFVSENFFAVLGVHAALGRTFRAGDVPVVGGDPEVVVSHTWWQRRLGGDPAAVGRTISINGVPMTVAGVAPAGFTGDIVGQPMDLWIPLMMQPVLMPHAAVLDDRTVSWLLLMGRLAPGVSLEQARVEVQRIAAAAIVAHAPPGRAAYLSAQVRDEPAPVAGGAQGFSYYRHVYAASLRTIMAAVLLVLLLVCANVANLMLGRALAREREMCLRLALGAGRGRLARQLLTEGLVLSGGGAALGLAFSVWGSAGLLRLASTGPAPIPLDLRLDGRIVAFTAVLAVLSALIFGLAPALRATRVDLTEALRAQGAAAGRPGGWRLGRALVAAQVAISLVLLTGTGMLLRSLGRLEGADIGAARDQLLMARIDADKTDWNDARLAAAMTDLLARARRVPGVADAAWSENGLFSGTESGTTMQVVGFTARADSDTSVAYDDVSPGYFHAIGARMLRGRDFGDNDGATGSPVAIMNQTMARYYFGGGDAVGRHILFRDTATTIVGVVADVTQGDLRTPPERRLYVPTLQDGRIPRTFSLELRVAGDPAQLAEAVRRALGAADPSLVVARVAPLTDLIGDSVSQDRMTARVITAFGLLALLLAGLGLYGVISYAATRRTAEFGLRIALGAQPLQVTGLVLRDALLLTAIGLAVGLPALAAGARLLRAQLFGIPFLDPPSIGAATVVLCASAALAGLVPALRAARAAPLDALRVP